MGVDSQESFISKKSKNFLDLYMSDEGECIKRRIVFGVVTITSKGQISIPVEARKALNIKEGDQLIVLRRMDDAGLTLIKIDAMDKLMYRLQEDENFFKKYVEVKKK